MGRDSLGDRLSLAFLACPACFSNEQAAITEGSHKIGQIVMRFPLVEVGDPIRRAQWGGHLPGKSECFTRIPALIRAYMRMILQVGRQAFLQLARKGLTNPARISRLETGKKA